MSCKCMFTQNLHKNVYTSFIHNCQKLEVIKVSFDEPKNCGIAIYLSRKEMGFQAMERQEGM